MNVTIEREHFTYSARQTPEGRFAVGPTQVDADEVVTLYVEEGLRRYLKRGRDRSPLRGPSFMDHWLDDETFSFLPDDLWFGKR